MTTRSVLLKNMFNPEEYFQLLIMTVMAAHIFTERQRQTGTGSWPMMLRKSVKIGMAKSLL